MKTYQLLSVLVFIIIIISCHTHEKDSTNTTIKQLKVDSFAIKIDSNQFIENIDTLGFIDSMLLEPFDLFIFKKKKHSSNSGPAKKKSYYLQPDFDGIYYRFFLFSEYGYIGKSKDSVIYKPNGLKIITYKPYGEFENEYLDSNEVLIAVIARYNDVDLPELAFVGLDSNEISKQLGYNYSIINNCMVYSYSDRVLILGMQNSYIDWLKYIHLSSEPDTLKEFDDLFELNNHGW